MRIYGYPVIFLLISINSVFSIVELIFQRYSISTDCEIDNFVLSQF